ncbi:hypothetical protein PIB30_099564 [Stylosanthes scabra]|uniref:Uncharacterized protein n=1 Tax=Stylosanthes scabra TaxID=79078 RepID=A0ABU6WV71_9FABA|nr:hypothetical protein [Stylosanthes scabra]
MLVVSSHACYVSQVLDYSALPFQQPLLGQYLQPLLLESYQKKPPFFCTTEKAISVEVLLAVVAKLIMVIASLRPVAAVVDLNLKKGTGDSGKKKRSRSGDHTSVVVDQRPVAATADLRWSWWI